ncbi:GNAT family N-acetyltransferase [Pseudarthrobacter sp. NS4]|uniref:GNAT family N-acetyltransferase n=1 Tax=Pseudarthrobacter sp. NS4 TaxID=2973976 RepID=UPI0021635908|nr:GNAT family N-acetyltransferase [Pseudarthrobacter sp. NS4]
MSHTIRKATADDAGALAALAAVTFPLACPPSSSAEDIAAHLANTLSEQHFERYLADPDITILVLDSGDRLNGYSLLVNRPAADPDVASVLTLVPSVELSKCYVHPEHHGLGAAAELMHASLRAAADAGGAGVWLGVNSQNARAIRFYEKSGFRKVGTKSFQLGTTVEHDFVLELALDEPPISSDAGTMERC